MKYFKSYLLLFVAAIALQGCGEKGSTTAFEISGTVKQAEGLLLQLEDFSAVPFVVMDSVRVTQGKFRLKGYAREGMYRLRMPEAENAWWVFYHNKGAKLQFDLDAGNIYHYTATGNAETEWLADMSGSLQDRRDSISQLDAALDTLATTLSDSLLAIQQAQMVLLRDNYKTAVKGYIESQANPTLAAYAMTFYGDVTSEINYFIERTELLLEQDPNAPFIQQVHEELTEIRDRVLAEQDKGLPVGSKAPEIALPSQMGDTIRLSYLKGKYVLLDFWASWCQPCREANPFLVSLYKKYNARGFEIFSVSLDKNKEQWNNARLKDGLIWRYHVSDLQMWRSPVVEQYRVNAIPNTYLLDPNGVILARNLHGKELENMLDSLLVVDSLRPVGL